MGRHNKDPKNEPPAMGPSPALLMLLVQRLPDTSLTTALFQGGREHFGWGADRYLQADVFDALNQNTRATGNWGKKGPPKIEPYPRPKVRRKAADGAKSSVSVKDIFKRFQRR